MNASASLPHLSKACLAFDQDVQCGEAPCAIKGEIALVCVARGCLLCSARPSATLYASAFLVHMPSGVAVQGWVQGSAGFGW